MFDSIKVFIKFQVMKFQWRKKNKNNYTYPKNLCDIAKIDIGDYTYGGIDAESYGCTNASLIIGKFCSIAQNVRFILDGEHHYKNVSTYPFKVRFGLDKVEAICKGPIIIGDDVWIGERSIILSGVHIGQGAVIGAGSVVRHDIPPYGIYVQDTLVNKRFSDEVIQKLMTIDYQSLTKEKVIAINKYLYSEVTIENVDVILSKLNHE